MSEQPAVPGRSVPEVIASIPVLSRPNVLRALAGGPLSDSWLVEDRGRRLVLRIDRPLARTLSLNRVAELAVLDAVAPAGLGPQAVWAEPSAGLLLTAYIAGDTWSLAHVQQPACLLQLAKTLRSVYALPTEGVVAFDPGMAAGNYARAIGTAAARKLAAQTSRLSQQLFAHEHAPVLCHNDLAHTNLVGFKPVRLIDWEYAAIGDPLFDLAVLVRYHALAENVARDFVRATLGALNRQRQERFSAYCELYDLLARLWYQATRQTAG